MKVTKPVAVVNPTSANGRTGRMWPRISEAFAKEFPGLTTRFTEKIGDGTTLTRQAIEEGADLIFSAGGDGTHSEVIGGFFRDEALINPEAVLAIIPRGTGGDFRKTLGMPTKTEDVIQWLSTATPSPIDAGLVRYHNHKGEKEVSHFINIASFGMGGLVDDLVDRTTKFFGGTVSFAIATLRALRSYTFPEVKLKIDDTFEESIRITNVAVANGKYFGGGMKVAPNAVIDDGVFDIIIIGQSSKTKVLSSATSIYSGKHLQLKYVRELRGKKVVAMSTEDVFIDIDGRPLGKLPLEVEILPKAVKLLRHN